MLPALLPGSRAKSFATYRDMTAALRERRVHAVLAYEWELRFSVGPQSARAAEGDNRDLVLLPYVFVDKYYAFQMSPKSGYRRTFNQALARVLDGVHEYDEWHCFQPAILL